MWFADEARVGQKRSPGDGPDLGPGAAPAPLPAGPPSRRAPLPAEPSAPQDQCTAFPCIFAAICPKDGKAAGVRREMRPPEKQFSDPLHSAALQQILDEISHLRHSGKMFEWADIDDAPRLYVEKNVQRERRSVASDCYALAMKVEHCNDSHAAKTVTDRAGRKPCLALAETF